MKRYQGSRAGSASSWRLRLSCKKNLNDSNTSENIENYFLKTKPVQEDSESSSAQVCDDLEVSNSESPYQNILAEMKPLLNNSLCEKSYFKTLEPVKRDAVSVGAATTAKLLSVKAQKPKKSRQITMSRLLEKQFFNSDTNADHLQLALALSRSMQDVENSSPKEKEEDMSAVYHPVQGNTILEQFGFNSRRKLGAKISTTNDVFKKRKKSRYQYITPVLFLRTDEDREKLIATKISLLLSQKNKSEVNGFQQQATSLSSSYLRSLNESGVYKLNQLTHEDLKKRELFYLDNLKVPQSTCGSGYLLKDWNGIFGREATPPRDIKNCNQLESNKGNMFREEKTPSGDVQPCLKKDSITSYHQFDVQALPAVTDEIKTPAIKPSKTCLSPNLFDSDDDSVVSDLKRSINEQLELSQRLISKSKSIFVNKSSSSEVDDDYKEKPTTCNDFSFSETVSAECLKYRNRSGIHHFESFQDESQDCCTPSKQAADFEGNPNFKLVMESLTLRTCENQGQNTRDIIKASETESRKNLQDFYDLTGSSDDESPISYIDTVKSCNKTKSFECSTLLENDNSIYFIESVLQSSNISRRLEKISASEETDSTACELQISSRIESKVEEKNYPISFNSSINSSCHSSNSNTELEKKSAQETVSDEELLLTAKECFKKTNSFTSELDEFTQRSVCISNEKTLSFLSDINSAEKSGRDFTFVSESDENLSDEESQNKINLCSPQSADCDSKNFLQNSLAGSNSKNFNSFSSTSDGNLSQESFSDEELNYSSAYTKSANISVINLEDSTSEEENVEEVCESATSNRNKLETSSVTELVQNDFKDIDYFDTNTEIVAENVLAYKTPENKFNKHNDNLIIKTKNITPMPNYSEMDTPGITKELQKFGLKNLKRKRGVEILHYIYNSMHPLISEEELRNISNDGCNPVKKRKKDDIRKKLESKYNENDRNQRAEKQQIELVGDLLQKNESNLIFEKKISTKLASCRVPLHIAWFNLVASHPEIKESILLYEPLQLEVLYSLLKEQGFKYCMKDLITFLDKKCITIRTNQS